MTPMWCSWMHLARLLARLVRRGGPWDRDSSGRIHLHTHCAAEYIYDVFSHQAAWLSRPELTQKGSLWTLLWANCQSASDQKFSALAPRSIAGGFQRASCKDHLDIVGPYIRDRLGHCREICWGRHRCDVLADLLCAGTSSVLNMSLHRLPQSPTEKKIKKTTEQHQK